MAGIGAGIDSYYEYLMKSYALLGNTRYLRMFETSYKAVMKRMRYQQPPLFLNVHMDSAEVHAVRCCILHRYLVYLTVLVFTLQVANHWIDSLAAFWPGLQVLYGDVAAAANTHEAYYALWRKFSAIPERYNWQNNAPEVFTYPLRPELVESTYILWRATKDPYYRHVGVLLLRGLEAQARAKCGYATLHDVRQVRFQLWVVNNLC